MVAGTCVPLYSLPVLCLVFACVLLTLTHTNALYLSHTLSQCVTNDYGRWQWESEARKAEEREGVLLVDIKARTAASMLAAQFCICPRGDTAGTSRVFDAITFGCIPVSIYIYMRCTFFLYISLLLLD